MATKKNRGAYRALGIDTNTTEDELTAALESRLTDDEKHVYKFDTRLTTDCIDSETQIAIFKVTPFTSGTPSFLAEENPYLNLRGKDVTIDAEFYGLTQLFPVVLSEIKLDIVALSGLNSHAYGSWTGTASAGTTKMWLQDFLIEDSELKKCRTMVFGYNTKYKARVQFWIEDYVNILLTEINKARESEDERKRPLVLMGHSFGGNIITHAYVRASRDEIYKDIYDSITGIFFFGVPFSGIDLDDVRSMLEDNEEFSSQCDGIAKHGRELLRYINYETRGLTEITRIFMKKVEEKETYIYSFYETSKTQKVIKLESGGYARCGKDILVVSQNSTELRIPKFEENLAVQADHSTIVKYKSQRDDTYATIRDRLKRTIKRLESPSSRPVGPQLESGDLEKMPCARSAMFDSYNDELDARCHPETRKELLSQIKEWANDPERECIFWLNGAPGTGKSTISRTVAQIFSDDDYINFGASFFFKRGESERDNTSLLFTTIAVQLSQKVPGLIPHIKDAIQKEPDIANKSLDKQFKLLVFQPLQKLSQVTSSFVTSGSNANQKPTPLIIVIDALDECKDNRERLVLYFFSEMKKLRTSCIDVRIFLTSRPELPIRLGFGAMPPGTHKHIVLQEIPPSIIEHDISVFLTAEFSKIRSEYWQELEFSPNWPGEETIEKLTKMATPLFVFAATICRFVGDAVFSSPEKRLNTILKSGTTEGLLITKLDQTYLPVLRQLKIRCPEDEFEQFQEDFRQIVGSVVTLADPLDPSSLANLLGVSTGDVYSKLQYLHSVFSVPSDSTQPIRLLHLSFRDFLVNLRKRSKIGSERNDRGKGEGTETNSDFWFWINEKRIQEELMEKCLTVLSAHLKQNICSLEYPGMPRRELRKSDIKKQLPRYVHLIDTLFLFFYKCKNSDLSHFLHDAKRFILRNLQIINKAPLQLYSSVLIFTPQTSIIRDIFQDCVPNWVHRFPESPKFWGGLLQRLENGSRVSSIAFSPDGKQLACASDRGIHFWSVRTGEPVKILEEDDGSNNVLSIAFSSDGKYLISASSDNTIRLWDVVLGKQLKIFKGHTRHIHDVAFSPNSEWVALAAYDNTITLWDVNTVIGRQTKDTERQIGETEPEIVATGEQKWVLVGHTNFVTKIICSPDGNLLASASLDGTIKFWNPTTGKQVHMFKRWLSGIRDIAFSPDGKQVAYAIQGEFGLLLVATGHQIQLQKFWRKNQDYLAVAFSPSGGELVLALADGTVALYDATTGQEIKVLGKHTDRVRTVSFSSNGGIVASASSDNTICLWDTVIKQRMVEWPALEQPMKNFSGHDSRICKLAFSPDGEKLASGSIDGAIIIWDVPTGWPVQRFRGHGGPIQAIAFSPGNEESTLLLASGSSDSTMRLWDITTGQQIKVLEENLRAAAIVFTSDGKQLALAGVVNRKSKCSFINLYDVASGQKIKVIGELEYSPFIGAMAFSPNEEQLLIVVGFGPTREIVFLEVATGQEGQRQRLKIEANEIFKDLYFSNDGSYLDTGIQIVPMLSNTPSRYGPRERWIRVAADGEWITRRGQNFIWLPPDYRGYCSALKGGPLAIGQNNGVVGFFGLFNGGYIL
ncbi:hypothetical protein TWF694_008219 [Orbilia ellipsospora]|uniref:Nephrocystin 3-like N-terminal domain-containing protein n=1 Tax=Orbilia ellipsospora TaxID=2528407 RepID=A0AAV9XIT9_9PEZI